MATTKRVSKKVVQDITPDEFNTALASYASSDAQIGIINNSLDKKIAELREKWAAKLDELGKARTAAYEVVQTYCEEKQEQLFTDKRSMETVHGLVGFRTGNPTLKTRKGFTWSAVLELLKVKAPGYVRIKEEPMKDRLLAERDSPVLAPMFRELGLDVDQDERFYVELKKEELAAA